MTAIVRFPRNDDADFIIQYFDRNDFKGEEIRLSYLLEGQPLPQQLIEIDRKFKEEAVIEKENQQKTESPGKKNQSSEPLQQFYRRKISSKDDNIENFLIRNQDEIAVKVNWQTWKSKQKGIVKFKKANIQKVIQLLSGQCIDSKNIQLQKIDENSVSISNLDQNTDEIYLNNFFEQYGEIESITIERQKVNEIATDSINQLEYIIKEFSQEPTSVDYIKYNELTGERTAKVHLLSFKGIGNVVINMNNEINILGTQKIHVKPHLIHYYQVEQGTANIMLNPQNNQIKDYLDTKLAKLKLYKQSQLVQKINKKKNKLATLFQNITLHKDKKNQQKQEVIEYNPLLDLVCVKLVCSNAQVFMGLKKLLDTISNGFSIGKEFDQQELQRLLTESGKKKLNKLCEKHKIVIKINQFYLDIKNAINMYCNKNQYKNIIKDIRNFLSQIQHLQLIIPENLIKTLISQIEQIQTQFNLENIKFNTHNRQLDADGQISDIELAKQFIMNLQPYQNTSEKSSKTNQEIKENCQICFQSITNPQVFLTCGHIFCNDCQQFYIKNAINDINQLPIKCPQCDKPLIIKDLFRIIADQQDMMKLFKLAINRFIMDNLSKYTFCLTPNCPTIQLIKVSKYQCQQCLKIYCNKCKTLYHTGLSCDDYKFKSDVQLQQFIKENDVRVCPNHNCKALLTRYDGCNKVQCLQCRIFVCWKKNCMKTYNTANQCYAHLKEVHGGYFDFQENQ